MNREKNCQLDERAANESESLRRRWRSRWRRRRRRRSRPKTDRCCSYNGTTTSTVIYNWLFAIVQRIDMKIYLAPWSSCFLLNNLGNSLFLKLLLFCCFFFEIDYLNRELNVWSCAIHHGITVSYRYICVYDFSFLQITTVPTAQHPSIVRTAKAERRLKEKMQREVINSIFKINIYIYIDK